MKPCAECKLNQAISNTLRPIAFQEDVTKLAHYVVLYQALEAADLGKYQIIITIRKHNYKTKLAYLKVGPQYRRKVGKGAACHSARQRQEGCDDIHPIMTSV